MNDKIKELLNICGMPNEDLMDIRRCAHDILPE